MKFQAQAGGPDPAKVEAPTAGEELLSLLREIDERQKGRKRPTEREILAEIQAYRKEKRASKVV